MEDVLAVRNDLRAENWMTIIQECSASGLSNKAFCKQRGISEKQYYYWLRKLRAQIIGSSQPQLVHLNDSELDRDEMLEIRYHGAELRLPSHVDMEAVTALLRTLQRL